jgi:hypothetical protein
MHAYLERARRGTSNWGNRINWNASQVQGGAWGASNTISDPLGFNADPNYIYKFHVVEARYPNTIQIKLPFDQFDASLSDNECNGWTLSGTTNVSRTSSGGTFTHTVTNNGPKAASYTWAIRGSYQGGGYTNVAGQSGTCNSVPAAPSSNSKCPNARSVSYTWPAGTPGGAQYCQRIYYTNADGPSSGTDHSTEKCITKGSGAPSGGICSAFTYTDPGTEVPSGASSARRTNTVVSITGVGRSR